jgi:hypothetical protein
MNALTVPQNSTPSRQTWNALSERLRGSLASGEFRAIAENPALLAEAERALPALRRDAAWGASAAEIMAVLAPRFALYPQPDRSEGEWEAWWADYTHALDDVPPAAIEAAMAEYVKLPDSEFFPKPGKLRELARTVPNALTRAVQTAQRAIDAAQNRPAEHHADHAQSAEPVDRDKVQAMLRDFHQKLEANKPPPKPERPPISGPVDERGLTQAMRDHMAQKDQRG